MFNKINTFTIESKIKKYKDEKSLQETGSAVISNFFFLKKKINKILDTFYLILINIDILLLKLKINIIKLIQLFFIIRFFLLYLYALLNFILILTSFILNFEYFFIINIFKDLFINIANNSICFCMEEQAEYILRRSFNSESASDISMLSILSDNLSDADMSSDSESFTSSLGSDELFQANCKKFLKTPEECRDRIDNSIGIRYPTRNQHFTYYLGSPYIKWSSSLDSLSQKLLIENQNLIIGLEDIWFNINFRNLPEDTTITINKSEYLTIFQGLISNLDSIIDLKKKAMIEYINIFEIKSNKNEKMIINVLNKTQLKKLEIDFIYNKIFSYYPINKVNLLYLENNINLIKYISYNKTVAVKNCELLNAIIGDNTIINNSIPLNFEPVNFEEFNKAQSLIEISDLPLFKNYYCNDILLKNNFEQNHYFKWDIEETKTQRFLTKNGFSIRR